MFSTLKLYFYGGIAAAIGIFITIFRMRGAKIQELKSKAEATKKKHEAAIMLTKFEARNKQKKEDVKHEKIDTVSDGNYTL